MWSELMDLECEVLVHAMPVRYGTQMSKTHTLDLFCLYFGSFRSHQLEPNLATISSIQVAWHYVKGFYCQILAMDTKKCGYISLPRSKDDCTEWIDARRGTERYSQGSNL